MTKKSKKVLNIVVTVIQILIVLVAIVLSIIVLVNPNIENGEVSSFKVKLLPVLTDSMKGNNEDSFESGDLLIAKTPEDATALNVGDIIVFQTIIGGKTELNTHRIIEKGSYMGTNNERIYWYQTKGDNNANPDTVPVYSTNVLAVVTNVLPNVGHAIAWLQQPNNFLVVIIVPLAVLFIYNIILFIRMIMASKLEKVKQEMEIQKSEAENIKQKAVQDYLQSLGYNPDNLPKADIKEPEVKAEELVPAQEVKAEEKTEIIAEEIIFEVKPEEVKIEEVKIEDEKPAAAPKTATAKPAAAKKPSSKTDAEKTTAKAAAPKTATPKTTAAKTAAVKTAETKSTQTKAPAKKPSAPKTPKE